MYRTNKALARLGTLAVVAGAALSAPFAVGTASASTISNWTVTTTNGTITSVNRDNNQNNYSGTGSVAITGATNGDVVKYTLLSGTAYFRSAGANVVIDSGRTTATCTVAGGTCGPTTVGDDVSEGAIVELQVTSPVGDVSNEAATVGFNEIQIANCTRTGFETGVNIGGGDATTANCITQAQAGMPLTENVTYLASGVPTSGQDLNFNISGGGDEAFSGSQPTGTTQITTTNAHCTTGAGGTAGVCGVTINDTNPLGEDVTFTVNTLTTPLAYPDIPYAGSPPVPNQLIHFVPHSVTPSRLDLISSRVIGPDSQSTVHSPGGEPGDVIQNTYEVRGGCTIPSGDVNCDTGQPLANATMTVATDKGFFTPNCVTPASTGGTPFTGVNNYANCSFSPAPASTGTTVVGNNLVNSGQSETVTTDLGGFFTVSLSIGRDTGFDANGLVVAHVTANSLPSLNTGNQAAGSCTGSPVGVPQLGGGGLVGYTDPAGCPEDFEWTTREQPLNGGTTKIAVIAALAQPNNTAIQSENNFTVDDTKTWNVPDVSRVVFVVHNTDQYANLTQDQTLGNLPTLTSTGPGNLWSCTSFSSTSACATTGTELGVNPQPGAGQPNGTTTYTVPAMGSYLNNVAGSGGQVRFQSDTSSTGGPFNSGWPCAAGVACNLAGPGASTQAGVNDGTTTVTDSWNPPTQSFTSFTAASGATPAFATFAAGSATTASTDTLTLNFYNQLAQPVVTFAVNPGNKVASGTGVTITATVDDQNGNPIVNQAIDALRSGSNEGSCQPTQTVSNGGAVTSPLVTNTSGVAGYTFSCSLPGASTVSMVVEGPGQTQLASGKQTITFTGVAQHTTVERPSVNLTSFHQHHLTVHVSTSPRLGAGRTVDVFRLVNGIKHLVGQTHTGPRGNASLTFHGLRNGATWRVAAKVINLGTQYRSEYSIAVSHRVK